MEIICEKSKLLKAISKVQKAIAPNSPLPILTGISLNADREKGLVFTATNLETAISTRLGTDELEVLSEGGAVLPAKYMTELFRRLPDEKICIVVKDGGSAVVRCASSEASLNSYPAEEYPSFPSIEGNTFRISGNALKNSIRRVSYAASGDLTRPVFCGVFCEVNGNEISMVATDTFRLAYSTAALPSAVDAGGIKFNVSSKTMDEVARLVETDDEVAITASDSQVLFSFEKTVVATRLIAGRFPSYKQLIPNAFPLRITARTKDLADAIDRAMLIISDTGMTNAVFTITEGKINVTAENTAGKIQEKIDANIQGDAITIILNSKYLMECFKNIAAEETVMELTSPLTPGIIRPAGDENYFSLIVPTRPR